MELIVLNSGSRANGYIIQNEDEALILECGCSITSALENLNHNVSKVKGVLVTHEHGDHSKYIEDYLKYFNVFSSAGTIQTIKYKYKKQPIALKPLKRIELGGFSIIPFETQHDSAEPFGYYIIHKDIGSLLFATDTYYLRYKFPYLTNIMIECNYCDELLKENVANGKIHPSLEKRTLESHMSLENCIDTLLANDISKVNNIILLHLSSRNSDSELFKNEVAKATHKNVEIAKKGFRCLISKTPF